MSVVTSFNATVSVTELLTKTLENVSKDLASRCIKECGLKYGFDAEEAIRELGLENLTLLKKKMSRKSVSSAVPKEKKAKEAKKAVFPFPFVSKLVNELGCQGLAFNRGLFTQCLKSRMENGGFCKGCQSEADKNASGCPDCGTVESRLNTGLYDFKDPKGRSPVSYLKVLNKLKLTAQQAVEEAEKMGLEIASEHLVVIEKSKKNPISRGRPKKVGGAVEAENVNDLFKKLSLDSDEESIEESIEEQEESEESSITEKPVKAAKKAKLSEEEKAAKKEALEKERQAKKEEREAQRKAEADQKKQEREAKLEADREAKKAKIEAEKKERQEKREADKAAKAAEKKTQPKKSKKAEPVASEPVAPEPVAPVAAPVAAPQEPVAEAPKKTTVTRIQISGKQYLKSSSNILYDPSTKEEVGLWNPITKKIEDLPDEEEDEEEEEEEYEDMGCM